MSSSGVAGVVQQLAAAMQPLISLDLWAQITSAALRSVQESPALVMQALLRISKDAIPQVWAASVQFVPFSKARLHLTTTRSNSF